MIVLSRSLKRYIKLKQTFFKCFQCCIFEYLKRPIYEKSRMGSKAGATSDQTYNPKAIQEEMIFTHIDAVLEFSVSNEEVPGLKKWKLKLENK